jgi:hypothetical protein
MGIEMLWSPYAIGDARRGSCPWLCTRAEEGSKNIKPYTRMNRLTALIIRLVTEGEMPNHATGWYKPSVKLSRHGPVGFLSPITGAVQLDTASQPTMITTDRIGDSRTAEHFHRMIKVRRVVHYGWSNTWKCAPTIASHLDALPHGLHDIWAVNAPW